MSSYWSRASAQTSLFAALLAAWVVAPSCGDYDPCEAHVGPLCDGTWRTRTVWVRVDDAVPIDVDGDGLPEQALLDRDARTVTIAWVEQEGRSEGYQLNGRVREIAAMEFDGDGVDDLAVLCDGPPRLVPLYVRGGELVEGEATPLAATPLSVATGDLDGDDRPELLIGHVGGVTVLRGHDWSLSTSAVAGAPVALDLADFDDDGALDVAAVNLDGATLEVLRGDGGGGLAAMASVSLGPGPEDLDLADIDGDGAVDVIVRSRLSDVWIVEGDGAGGFAEPWSLAVDDGEGYPGNGSVERGRGVLAIPGAESFGVVTPDRLIRAAVSDAAGEHVGALSIFADHRARVLRDGLVAGLGFAFELTANAGPSLLVSEGPELGALRGPITAADLDNDGFFDIVALSEACEIQLFAGGPEGVGPALLSGATYEDCPSNLQVADVTGDGRPDLIASGSSPGGLELTLAVGLEGGGYELGPTLKHDAWVGLPVILGRPEGATLVFLDERVDDIPFVVDVDATGAMSVAEPLLREIVEQVGRGDVDGDGQDDLVAMLLSGPGWAFFRVYYGVDGGLVPGPILSTASSFSPLETSGELVVRDLDGDDRAEMVLISANNIATITGLDGAPSVLDEHPVEGGQTWFALNGASTLVDLDGDGAPEFVRVLNDRIFAVHGEGDGRFADEGAVVGFRESVQVVPADLGGDGRGELIVQEFDDRVWTVESRAIGLPELGALVRLPGGAFFSERKNVSYGDFNGDGHRDVVTVGNQVITSLWGDGGTFRRSSSRYIPDGGNYSNHAAADLDEDGRDELLVYDENWGLPFAAARVLRWDGSDWRSTSSLPVPSGGSPAGLHAADLDGDGALDLAVSPGADWDNGLLAAYIAYGRQGLNGVHELAEPVRVEIAVDREAPEGYWQGYWQGPVSLSSGDLDGDGRPELLIDGSAPGHTHLLWNDGGRKWSAVALPAASASIAGVGELITVDPSAIRRVPVYGRRLAEGVTSVKDPPEWENSKIKLLDCNGDLSPDLSISERSLGQLWFGVGETFVSPLTGQRLIGHHCEDVDGDGVIDLLGMDEGRLVVLLSGGGK